MGNLMLQPCYYIPVPDQGNLVGHCEERRDTEIGVPRCPTQNRGIDVKME
jgi:hypothetical protein